MMMTAMVAAMNVTANNRHPRIYGDKIDIGACEYYQAPGLMLLVR